MTPDSSLALLGAVVIPISWAILLAVAAAVVTWPIARRWSITPTAVDAEDRPFYLRPIAFGFLILAFGLALWFWIGWYIPHTKNGGTSGGAGEWGDQFGGVNSLFTCFAMAGAIYALVLQIQAQKDENKHRARIESQTQDQVLLQTLTARISALQMTIASFDEHLATLSKRSSNPQVESVAQTTKKVVLAARAKAWAQFWDTTKRIEELMPPPTSPPPFELPDDASGQGDTPAESAT